MASENTAVRWILGCLAAVVVTGLVCGGLLIYFVPKWVKEASEIVRSEFDVIERAESWQPPANDVSPDALFPASLGEFQLQGHQPQEGVPPFFEELSGHMGTYQSETGQFQVYAFQATDLEQEGVTTRINDQLEDNATLQSSSNINGFRRLTFSGFQGQKGYLWGIHGWMFFFLTSDNLELKPLVEEYVEKIENAGGFETQGADGADGM